MTTFVLAYHGGAQPKTPEEGKQHMQKYMAWLSSLGEKAIYPQMPFINKRSVTASGVTEGAPENFMMGMTVIEVASMDEALSLAEACPFLDMENSSITVAEVMDMPG